MPVRDEPNDKRKSGVKSELGNELETFRMEELLQMYDEKMSEFSEGDIVSGRVLKVNATEVIVDIGYKSEGMIPISQLSAHGGTDVVVKVGDKLDVYIERLEDPSGYVMLSKERAERVKVWDVIEEAFRDGKPITGKILDRVKGGLAVDVGVKAFLPGSQVDVRPVKNLDSLKGKELPFKIISFDKKRNNIVLSHRAIAEVEQNAKKKQTFEQLKEGESTHGIVKNITDYGVFVDLGGVDGLLHITDISWGRVNHPSEFFNVADEIEVIVLKFDPANERVSLGYKQKSTDPWADVATRYPLGTKVHGKVVSITDYGAFIELEEGVEGLIHISEMSWTRKVHPSKLLASAQEVDAVVTDVNVSNRRISLSLKALESNPWETISGRYPIGSLVTGRVRNLTDFGAFVEVEEGIDGLIHISDMSWSRRLKHPSEVMKKGDNVTARVLNVDGDNQRLSLSIKEFLPNEWDDYAKSQSIGNEVIGTISKITDFGVFVRLSEGVEGLVHVSEINKDPRTKLDKMFEPSDPVRARVIKIETTEKRIGLSFRDVEPLSDEERDLATAALNESHEAERRASEKAGAAGEDAGADETEEPKAETTDTAEAGDGGDDPRS